MTENNINEKYLELLEENRQLRKRLDKRREHTFTYSCSYTESPYNMYGTDKEAYRQFALSEVRKKIANDLLSENLLKESEIQTLNDSNAITYLFSITVLKDTED